MEPMQPIQAEPVPAARRSVTTIAFLVWLPFPFAFLLVSSIGMRQDENIVVMTVLYTMILSFGSMLYVFPALLLIIWIARFFRVSDTKLIRILLLISLAFAITLPSFMLYDSYGRTPEQEYEVFFPALPTDASPLQSHSISGFGSGAKFFYFTAAPDQLRKMLADADFQLLDRDKEFDKIDLAAKSCSNSPKAKQRFDLLKEPDFFAHPSNNDGPLPDSGHYIHRWLLINWNTGEVLAVLRNASL